MLAVCPQLTDRSQSLQVLLPSGIYHRIGTDFLDVKGGTKTSAQWRTFTEVYEPLIWPVIWRHNERLGSTSLQHNPLLSDDELECSLLLSEVNILALRPVISQSEVEYLAEVIRRWQDLVFKLHPGIQRTRNWHQLSHLVHDILLHGPSSSLWVLAAKRLGKLLKAINTNGKQVETTLLQGRYKAAMSSLLQAQLLCDATTDAERITVQQLADKYQVFMESDQSSGAAANRLLDEMNRDIKELETCLQLARSAPDSKRLTPFNGELVEAPKHSLLAIRTRLSEMDPSHDYYLEGEQLPNPPSPCQITLRTVAVRYRGIANQNKTFKSWPSAIGSYRTANLAAYKDTLFCFRKAFTTHNANTTPGGGLWLLTAVYDIQLVSYEGDTSTKLVCMGRRAVPLGDHRVPSVLPAYYQQ